MKQDVFEVKLQNIDDRTGRIEDKIDKLMRNRISFPIFSFIIGLVFALGAFAAVTAMENRVELSKIKVIVARGL